jgi:hypothetical protein
MEVEANFLEKERLSVAGPRFTAIHCRIPDNPNDHAARLNDAK